MKKIELYDFVKPWNEDGVWRVIKISGDVATAELRQNELEPKTIRRISAKSCHFEILE